MNTAGNAKQKSYAIVEIKLTKPGAHPLAELCTQHTALHTKCNHAVAEDKRTIDAKEIATPPVTAESLERANKREIREREIEGEKTSLTCSPYNFHNRTVCPLNSINATSRRGQMNPGVGTNRESTFL